MKTIITSQGSLVKLRIPQQAGKRAAGGGKRGKITKFSNASRKRLLELFAKLVPKKFIFITLTYGQEFPDAKSSKRHLKNFIQKLKRKSKNVSGVWRLEFQERGAPHYHLLMTNLPFIDMDELCQMWENTIGSQYWNNSVDRYGMRNKTFTRIELCNDKKKVMSYVSKYVAKKSGAIAPSGFNYVAYQHAPLSADNAAVNISENPDVLYGCDTLETHQMRLAIIANHAALSEKTEEISVGRWWGYIGREHLPFAHKSEIEWVGEEKTFHDFKRSILAVKRAVWRGIPYEITQTALKRKFAKHISKKRTYQGLTLFSDDAHKWLKYWIVLSGSGIRETGEIDYERQPLTFNSNPSVKC